MQIFVQKFSTDFIRINFAEHSFLSNEIFNELNVYNLDVFNSYIYVEIIFQECKTKYK